VERELPIGAALVHSRPFVKLRSVRLSHDGRGKVVDVLAHLIFGLHLIIIKPIGDTLGLGDGLLHVWGPDQF